MNLYSEIEKFISDKARIKYNELMSNHTTFKVGGVADCFVVVNSEIELIQIIKYLKENKIHFFVTEYDFRKISLRIFLSCNRLIFQILYQFGEAAENSKKSIFREKNGKFL